MISWNQIKKKKFIIIPYLVNNDNGTIICKDPGAGALRTSHDTLCIFYIAFGPQAPSVYLCLTISTITYYYYEIHTYIATPAHIIAFLSHCFPLSGFDSLHKLLKRQVSPANHRQPWSSPLSQQTFPVRPFNASYWVLRCELNFF